MKSWNRTRGKKNVQKRSLAYLFKWKIYFKNINQLRIQRNGYFLYQQKSIVEKKMFKNKKKWIRELAI